MADGQIRYKVGFDIQKKGLDQLKASLQDLQKMKISDIMKINGSTASEAKAIFRDIQDQASKVEAALTKAFNPKLNAFNLQAFNTALASTDLNLDKIYQDFSKAGTTGQVAFRQLSNQLLRVNNRVRESHAILDKMATTLANTIKWNAASGAVNGLTRSVQQAWGYVKALDGSLNDIRIVTGKSADDMANFAVQANNAAKELGRTTTDYTNAALIFAQQGLSDAEIEQRAKITLKAANVTGQSTDAVSEQLTAVWNGYKVTAEEAQLYVDRLAAVAATTASDLEELSTGMSKVASAAAAMGVGEDQLAAQLSTIISVTRQAPETVGTALRTVYARISDIEAGIEEDGVTLGNYSGEMAKLGFNVLDASGHLRDMGEVMQEIGGRWNYLTREQQISLAQTMAGQRQYSNLIALFDNFQKYDQALYTAQNAAGTLQEQQDIAMESMGAHLNVLKASIQDVYDSLVNQDALDAIKGLVDGLANASTTMAKLIDSVGGGIPILTSLGALGFSVFTNQIAGSIQTTINNFQAAQREAEELQRKISMIEESRGTGDETTQALGKRREEILSMSPNLSDSMTQELQKGLDDWVEAANKVDLTKAKFEELKGTFETAAPSLEEFTLGYKDLSEALSTDTGIQQIKEGLKQVQKQFKPVEDSYKILREAVIDFNRQTDEVGKTKSFEFLKDQVNELVNTLHSAKTDSGREIFETLPQEAQKSIKQAQKTIESLDFSALSSPEAQGQITGAFQQIAKVITSKIEAIKKAMESADDGTLPKLAEQLEAAEKALKATQEASDKQVEQATAAVQIKNLTDMASGFSRVAAGILQIKNLGRIWTQQDVSLGDKILQTVQNLAFSLPMLISGLKAASIGLKILTIEEGVLAKKTIENIWGQNAHAIAFKFTGDAAQEAAIKVKFFDQVLNISSGGIALAVLAGIVAALVAVADGFEKARKAAIENDKEIINQQKDIQEEINSHRELYKTLDDLKEKYSQNKITRAELKGQIQDLIAQYGLEGEAAEALKENYTDLTQAALELQKVQAQRGVKSATQGVNAAEDKLDKTLNNKNQLSVMKTGGASNAELMKSLNLEGKDFTVKWDGVDEFVSEYDRIQSIVNDAYALVDKGLYSKEQLKDFPILTDMENFLKTYKQDVEEYRTQKELLQKYSTEQILADSQLKGDINLQEVDSAVKYLEQKKKVVEEIQSILNEAGDTDSNASKMADTYLKEQFGNLYNQYDETANLINQIAEKTGQLPDGIEQIFKQMDQSQLGALLNIDGLDLITSWEELYEIIKSISEIDFRNLEQVKQAAIGNFNTLQGVQDSVKKGQGIDADSYASLTPEIQSFFEITLDGTYKLKGSAQDFYNAIDDAKLQGFIQTAGKLADQQQKLANLKSSNFNYEDLDKMVTHTGSNGAQMGDQNQVDSQLAYLQALGQADGELAAQVQIWKSLSDQERYSAEIAEEIYQKIGQVGDQTTDLQEKTKQLEGQVANLSRLWMDATVPLDQDISADAVAELADYIQEIAEESQDFSDALATDRDAAENVAEAILRFNDAIDDVSKNYKDWIKQLESGADGIEDQANLIGDLRDAYGDLLDIDGSNLSQDFVLDPENLNLMKAALEGDLDAYNQLANAVSNDIQVQIVEANPEWAHTLQGEFDYLRNLINNNPMAIEADPSGAMNAFQHVADAAFQMTGDVGAATQLINDYASSLGYDVALNPIEGEATDTTEEYDITKVTSQKPVRETRPIYRTQTFAGKEEQVLAGTTTETGWTTSIDTRITPVTAEGTKKTTAVGLQVTKVGKGATGAAKIGNAKKAKIGSSGGGKGKSGGGKKKKGGGGGSSTSKADTSQKDTKKPLKNDLDIYHDVNVQIGKINRNLNRAQKQQQRLFGKDLLKNLTDQKDLLEEHNKKLKEKHDLQIKDLANQKKILQSLGVTFDEYGNIKNYMDILQKKQKNVNDLINQYNKKVEQYNKLTDKTKKESLSKEIEKISKKIEDAEDVYKDLEDKIGNYDDLREEMQELLDQIQENTQQQIELTIQGFRTELEIRLDLGQAERDWNEFRRNVLQKTNILKDMEFDEIFKDALKNIDDIYTYIGKEGSIGTIATLMQQLEDTQAEIQKINENDGTGVSAIYGTDKAQAMEDLESDLDQLISQLEDIEDLVNEVDEAYLDTIDDIADQFDAQIQEYEYVGELLEHDMDLLSLLYGDKNYDAMNRYYTALAENNNKQLDFLREQANYWQQNWVKAMEEGNVQAAKEFEEHYKDTIDNLNSLISDSVENLQDKYINAIEQIFDTLDRKITNGKGMDYLGMEWDLLNKNAEDYLDTINAAFAVQDLERKYNKALGETTSIKNQRALKKVMDEQLNNLKAKDKLTQYDVDRAEKLLEIEKARIALEDVRAQKTSLRLKRDSQGNYSYEYVADMDEVAEAQEALAAAQNDLYNFDKEQYQSNVDEVLAAWQDFQSEYKDIITDLSLTEEDRVNKLKLLREQYGKYINNKTAENAVIRVNLMDSAFADLAAIYEQDVQNYMQMADEEKDIIMNQLVPAWSSGVQEMANLIIDEGGFIPVCQQAFDNIAEVTEEYAKELQTLGIIAGVNFEELKEGADYVADSMASLIKQNDELISSMKLEMEAIDLLRKQAQKLSKDYNDVTKSAAAAVTKIQEFVKAQKTAAAQAAKENKPATTASKNSSSSTTSKTTSTSNTSNNSTSNKNTSSNTSSSGTSTAKETASKLAQNLYDKLKEKMLNGGSGNSSGQNKTQTTSGGGGTTRLIARLATGGYTGEWNSEEGRLAFLHEKELVLNEQDTKNVLNSVSILRTLMGSLNTTVANKIFDLNHGNKTSLLQSVGNNENVNQAVQISATFPNVNSRREIEEAFNNLVNMAAQRALE